MAAPSTPQILLYAFINYEDPYVQPLIISALSKNFLPDSYQLINSLSDLPSSSPLLQWLQYEFISFDTALIQPQHHLVNAYIIRKALIRKHYLSSTISHWLAKNPSSLLKDHFKQGVEFELDYAEFLDDALDEAEAWELRESWVRNEGKEAEEREWWILKAGMSDRGQGIRLFSSEEELSGIFEEWENGEDEDGKAQDGDTDEAPMPNDHFEGLPTVNEEERNESKDNTTMTSHLRHFLAQPYIHPPLLLPSSGSRKFHIRTYVLAVGALKLYIYKPMLALFASSPYLPPWQSQDLRVHLTNTCLQGTHILEGSVRSFWDLDDSISLPFSSPSDFGDTAAETTTWKDDVWQQICGIAAQTFEAASRVSSVHFQPLPNAFEIFGLDFLVDGYGRAWLLEVNAFPDFRQTGEELKGVVEGLFEEVVRVAVMPFFGGGDWGRGGTERMRLVLDLDLGR